MDKIQQLYIEALEKLGIDHEKLMGHTYEYCFKVVVAKQFERIKELESQLEKLQSSNPPKS